MELCWWPLSTAWLSPGAALFIFFNVLVGAIAVMSRDQQRSGVGPPSRRRLRRSASSMVLDRLRLFSMFPIHPTAECYYHTHQEAGEGQVGGSATEQPRPEPQSAPAEALADTDATTASMLSETRTDAAEAEEEKSASFDEASVQVESQSAPAAAADEVAAAVERPGKKKKQRRRRATEEAVEGKAELNARAELFIRQFREDLKLQRLNSIINYTRALRRRAGAAPAQEQN
ncbi:hypothetical protein EJB05_49347, partial [Eragrostis curvula]